MWNSLSNDNPLLPSFMTYHLVCNKSNMTGVTCGSGTAYPSGAPKFTSGSCYSIFCFLRNVLWIVAWTFCCLSFNLRLLVTTLVSSSISCHLRTQNWYIEKIPIIPYITNSRNRKTYPKINVSSIFFQTYEKFENTTG